MHMHQYHPRTECNDAVIVPAPIARAWTRMPSGARFDLINPSPDGWSDSDLAIRLSRTFRWSGESRWPLPLSVAQHSLTELALRRLLSPKSLTPMEALRELLHDAEEGIIGFDPLSPLKPILGSAYHALAGRITDVIFKRYSVTTWSAQDYVPHKQADWAAAASEAVHCVGWTRSEVSEVLGIAHPVLDVDPLAAVYGCEPWMPWPSDIAAERFLNELSALVEAGRQSACAEFV